MDVLQIKSADFGPLGKIIGDNMKLTIGGTFHPQHKTKQGVVGALTEHAASELSGEYVHFAKVKASDLQNYRGDIICHADDGSTWSLGPVYNSDVASIGDGAIKITHWAVEKAQEVSSV